MKEYSLIKRLEGHYGSITTVLLTKDNKYIISSGLDKIVNVYNF